MREIALKFVRRTVEIQHRCMTVMSASPIVGDGQYNKSLETLMLWEYILKMMEESPHGLE